MSLNMNLGYVLVTRLVRLLPRPALAHTTAATIASFGQGAKSFGPTS
jgi:hypothetical protein